MEKILTKTVTVKSKSSNHPYFSQGSSKGYFIDEIESPSLNLVRNVVYRFDQSDPSNSNHQIQFFVDANKSVAYQTDVKQIGIAGTQGAYTEILISEGAPTKIFYQCQNHPYMGSLINLSSSVITTTNGLTKGNKYNLSEIQDYDGNLHGFLSEAPTTVKSAYKYQGTLDVNNDGTQEAIYTNQISGRWVTASIDPITGVSDYSEHGQGGTTRIVGIYEDPLVKAGLVEKDSDLDGSRTFINDLKLDNLILKTVGDYDGDGFQEVYWSKVDNTAYLRAVMHADGNIQYANYQNLTQMTDYLTNHGFVDTVSLIA